MKGARANFFYNVLGSALPIVSAFVTVPIYIAHIGADRYGVVAIAWLLLGYFGFLDFGLSRASANALSKLGNATASERSPVIMTAIYLNIGVGLLGGLIMFVAGDILLEHVFNVPGSLRNEAIAAFPWMAAMLPLGMLSGVATGVLESRERFLLSNTLSAAGTVAGQLGPLAVAVFLSPHLDAVVPAMLLVRVATLIASLACVFCLEQPLGVFDLHLSWVRQLFGYGLWVSVSSLISPLLEGLDQLLIGAVLGSAAIAHYAVPMNLATRSQIVAVALARALFPRLSRENLVEARLVAQQAVSALAYGFGAVCGPAIIMANFFLQFWLGAEFASVARNVTEVLLIGAWINGIAFIPYSMLQGQGRPDLTAKLHMAEILPFIGGLWFLMHWFGLVGATIAWTARVSIDCIILLVLGRTSPRAAFHLAPAVILMVLCEIEAIYSPVQPIVAAIVAGLMFIVAGLAFNPLLREIALVALTTRIGKQAPNM
jgi:O-antigen/teichoic acid export membrane protein